MTRPASANAKYIFTLAAVSVLILVLGSLFRPRPRSADQPQPSETDLARLTRLTERRSLETRAGYFAQLADDVATSVVRMPDAGASGVVWTTGTIATARLERRFPATTLLKMLGRDVRASGAIWAPHLPVVGLQAPDVAQLVPARRAVAPARSGDWLVAVWRTDQGRVFAPANFLDVAPVSCDERPSREMLSTLVFTRSMAGGGLFDIDGNLIGLILPCGERYAAVVLEQVDAMLSEAESFGGRLLARYGLAVGPMTDDETEYFKGAAGVIVREVWIGFSGEVAGLRPGDIIVALNGNIVASADDLQPLVAQTEREPPVLSVRRDAARLEITLAVDASATARETDRQTTEGLVWESPQKGYRIDAVLPGSRAAAAGIRPGDRLLRIGRAEPRSLDQMRRLLTTGRTAAFVEIERDGRRRGTLLKQAEP